MIFGRDNEFKALTKLYEKNINQAVIVYGHEDNNVTDLVKEFIKNKEFFYYDAIPVSNELQLKKFNSDISSQLSNKTVSEITYESVLHSMLSVKCEKRVIVISNFQNIVKSSPDFMQELIKCLNDKWNNQPVMFILVSENPYWVEKQMIDKMGDAAYEISGIIKINNLRFLEFINYFKNYNLMDLVTAYSIIGGRSSILQFWDSNESVKNNIEKLYLSENSLIYQKGRNLLPEELREPAVYNTLLLTIASGKEKLNDIHKETGFSRAKISVYLNNLIDFEIIEKIDSFDSPGRDNAQKGIYRIKDSFVNFYFKFIYAHSSEISVISKDKFYKKYIESQLINFSEKAFRIICVEYLSLLNKINKLTYSFKDFGCWVGKVGTIDIVSEDNQGNNLIGFCNWETEVMSYEDYEWLLFCVKQAKLSADVIYLFSRGSFDERIIAQTNNNPNIYLIDSTML